MNRELTAIHSEVIFNLKSELGIALRTNRSIQAEGISVRLSGTVPTKGLKDEA